MSVPSDRLFVQVYVNLFRLEILFDAPGAEFAPESGLLVSAPRRFHVSGLHVIYPNNPGTQRFHHAEGLKNITTPYGRSQAVRRGIGNAQRFRFIRKRDDGRDRTEDFFLRDACGVVHIVKNSWLDIIAALERRRASPARRDLPFFLAQFLIRADAVKLVLAYQRAHLRFAL